MLQRRAVPQSEAQRFRDELSAGVEHLRQAVTHACALVGPRVRAAGQRWGPARGWWGRTRSEERGGGVGRWALPVGALVLGTAVVAVVVAARRRRRRWEEDAEAALEEITEGGATLAPETGVVADEAGPSRADD